MINVLVTSEYKFHADFLKKVEVATCKGVKTGNAVDIFLSQNVVYCIDVNYF